MDRLRKSGRDGSALIFAMMFVLVISILITSGLSIGLGLVGAAATKEQERQAYYTARSVASGIAQWLETAQVTQVGDALRPVDGAAAFIAERLGQGPVNIPALALPEDMGACAVTIDGSMQGDITVTVAADSGGHTAFVTATLKRSEEIIPGTPAYDPPKLPPATPEAVLPPFVVDITGEGAFIAGIEQEPGSYLYPIELLPDVSAIYSVDNAVGGTYAPADETAEASAGAEADAATAAAIDAATDAATAAAAETATDAAIDAVIEAAIEAAMADATPAAREAAAQAAKAAALKAMAQADMAAYEGLTEKLMSFSITGRDIDEAVLILDAGGAIDPAALALPARITGLTGTYGRVTLYTGPAFLDTLALGAAEPVARLTLMAQFGAAFEVNSGTSLLESAVHTYIPSTLYGELQSTVWAVEAGTLEIQRAQEAQADPHISIDSAIIVRPGATLTIGAGDIEGNIYVAPGGTLILTGEPRITGEIILLCDREGNLAQLTGENPGFAFTVHAQEGAIIDERLTGLNIIQAAIAGEEEEAIPATPDTIVATWGDPIYRGGGY